MSHVLAVDPGIHKCGLVLVDIDRGFVVKGNVVAASLVIELIKQWKQEYLMTQIFLGNGTSSSQWEQELELIAPLKVVNEEGTTLRARQRYWEIWPPSPLLRWLPRGLILPPNDLDAVAALVLLEDEVEMKFSWPGSPVFKTEL